MSLNKLTDPAQYKEWMNINLNRLNAKTVVAEEGIVINNSPYLLYNVVSETYQDPGDLVIVSPAVGNITLINSIVYTGNYFADPFNKDDFYTQINLSFQIEDFQGEVFGTNKSVISVDLDTGVNVSYPDPSEGVCCAISGIASKGADVHMVTGSCDNQGNGILRLNYVFTETALGTAPATGFVRLSTMISFRSSLTPNGSLSNKLRGLKIKTEEEGNINEGLKTITKPSYILLDDKDFDDEKQ